VEGINILAVVVAAVSSFVLGGLWYSPMLFGKKWNRDAGMEGKQGGHPARVFGLAFVFALVAAYAFAWLLGPDPAPRAALHQALLVGIGFVATSFGINYQFANRPITMWLIDAGYHVMQFVLYALVLAYWP
jgi:hypothetical protein